MGYRLGYVSIVRSQARAYGSTWVNTEVFCGVEIDGDVEKSVDELIDESTWAIEPKYLNLWV
jgi:hypothetical protein